MSTNPNTELLNSFTVAELREEASRYQFAKNQFAAYRKADFIRFIAKKWEQVDQGLVKLS